MRQEKKEGGRGLANIEDSMDASIYDFEDFTKTRKERVIIAVSNSTENIRTNRITITRETEKGRKTTV